MTSLESVVLPLAESRALVERGVVLDTALVWVNAGQGFWNGGGVGLDKDGIVRQIPITPTGGYADEVRVRSYTDSLSTVLCPAPVLSELLDAIRAKAHPVFLGIDGLFWTVRWVEPSNGMPLQERSTSEQNDLLAAAALLMEVSK